MCEKTVVPTEMAPEQLNNRQTVPVSPTVCSTHARCQEGIQKTPGCLHALAFLSQDSDPTELPGAARSRSHWEPGVSRRRRCVSRQRKPCVLHGWAWLALNNWRTCDEREVREGESLERIVRTGGAGNTPRTRGRGVRSTTADVHACCTPLGELGTGASRRLGHSVDWGTSCPGEHAPLGGAGSSPCSSSETPGPPSTHSPHAPRSPRGHWEPSLGAHTPAGGTGDEHGRFCQGGTRAVRDSEAGCAVFGGGIGERLR